MKRLEIEENIGREERRRKEYQAPKAVGGEVALVRDTSRRC